MAATIRFDRSEACAESHNLPVESKEIAFDDADGSWVQLTYDCLRTQEGSVIATLDNGCWLFEDQQWSDVVIAFD